MADYSTYGFNYGSSTVAGAAGGLLTWALDTSVPAFFAPILRAAFDDWTAHANIQFQQVSSIAGATIKFTLSAIDGLNNTLGTGGSSYYLSLTGLNKGFEGKFDFDSGENWHQSGGKVVSDGGVNLFAVALHEIGHVIGLGHYDSGSAIMNSYLSPGLTDLTASDIDGIQYLYGAPKATGAWAGLVNQNYYNTLYTDVARTGTDAVSHYSAFGWLEGRDPDVLFSTNGYRAANGDVAEAGINPLGHYDQYGWKEGRDPSAAFDTTAYLAANPDVAAAHLDPLQHYLQFGATEGRHLS